MVHCICLLSFSIMFQRFIHVVALVFSVFLLPNNTPLYGNTTTNDHQLLDVKLSTRKLALPLSLNPGSNLDAISRVSFVRVSSVCSCLYIVDTQRYILTI